jgi:hypothetical protein
VRSFECFHPLFIIACFSLFVFVFAHSFRDKNTELALPRVLGITVCIADYMFFFLALERSSLTQMDSKAKGAAITVTDPTVIQQLEKQTNKTKWEGTWSASKAPGWQHEEKRVRLHLHPVFTASFASS